MLGLLTFMAIALALLIALLSILLAWQMAHPPRRTAAWAIARNLPADPADLDLPFEQWTLDRPDGALLPVWEITRATQPAPHVHPSTTQQPLTAIMLHGWGHSRVTALQRMQTILPCARRIILYDLRGHGDATGSAAQLGDGEHHDLIALMQRLAADRILLVGHSMGAVIALAAAAELARTNNPLVRQLVGVIAYAPYCEFHVSLQGRMRSRGYPTRPITDLALLIHRIRGIAPLSLDRHTLQHVQAPLLIVHGEQDEVSPLVHCDRIGQAVKHAIIHRVPRGRHVDAHLLQPEEHQHAVHEFIAHLP